MISPETIGNWIVAIIVGIGAGQSLHLEVSYDPSGDAARWIPRPEIPTVIIDPHVAFGQPTLRESGIPTHTLFEAFQAEKDDFESVAKWFQIDEACVREAVQFEIKLAMAA